MPAPPITSAARDLLDVAASIIEIEMTLSFCAKGLANVWEYDRDQAHARFVALRTLRRAREDLANVIADLENLPVGERV